MKYKMALLLMISSFSIHSMMIGHYIMIGEPSESVIAVKNLTTAEKHAIEARLHSFLTKVGWQLAVKDYGEAKELLSLRDTYPTEFSATSTEWKRLDYLLYDLDSYFSPSVSLFRVIKRMVINSLYNT